VIRNTIYEIQPANQNPVFLFYAGKVFRIGEGKDRPTRNFR